MQKQINLIQLRHDMIIAVRLWFSAFAIFFFAEALIAVIHNPFVYVVSSTFGIYLGHTMNLLIVIPVFLYVTWRFNPIYAPFLMIFYYGLHEFIFNVIFMAYYWPITSSPNFWLNVPFCVDIIMVWVAILLFERGKFNLLRSRFSKVFLFGFAVLMIVWIFGFHLIVTLNFTLPPALNDLNTHKLIPNLFEQMYNSLFAGLFVTSLQLGKKENAGISQIEQ